MNIKFDPKNDSWLRGQSSPSDERQDTTDSSGKYKILHKIKLPSKDDPAVMQVIFKLKSRGLA